MKQISENYYESTAEEIISDTSIQCCCGFSNGINRYSESDRLELSMAEAINGVCTIVYICPACGEELTIDYRLNEYRYEASFEGEDMPTAYGHVAAVDRKSAETIVYDICGTWSDENGKNFEAGFPKYVSCDLVVSKPKNK